MRTPKAFSVVRAKRTELEPLKIIPAVRVAVEVGIENSETEVDPARVFDPRPEYRHKIPGAYGWKRINATQVPRPGDLKALRLALGLTVQQCADLVRVNKSSWCRWESTEPTIMANMSLMAWDLFLHKTVASRRHLVLRMKELQSKLEKG